MPLDSEVIDAVMCAQSFHWFATGRALAEIRRVLKPGGVLGLIWNARDHSVPWVARFNELLDAYDSDGAPRHQDGNWKTLFPEDGFSLLAKRSVSHGHTGTPEKVIIDRGLSVSFIAALPEGVRREVEAEFRNHINGTPELKGQSEVTFPYVTNAYWCTKLKG